MPKMSVAERLLMLRKMRQASLEKKEAVASAAPMEQEEEVSHFEKNKKTDIENNAIVGLETLASGTPELPMEICDEAPEPRPRAEAPVPHDPAESPSWDLQRKISRQIEYYFGDYNLPRDKFMLDLMLEDEGRFRKSGSELIVRVLVESTSCLTLFQGGSPWAR